MGATQCCLRQSATVTPAEVHSSNMVEHLHSPPTEVAGTSGVQRSASYIVNLSATVTFLSDYQRQRLRRYLRRQRRNVAVSCVTAVKYQVDLDSGSHEPGIEFVIDNPHLSWGTLPVVEQVPQSLPPVLGVESVEWFAVLRDRDQLDTSVSLWAKVGTKSVCYTARVVTCECGDEKAIVDKVIANMEQQRKTVPRKLSRVIHAPRITPGRPPLGIKKTSNNSGGRMDSTSMSGPSYKESSESDTGYDTPSTTTSVHSHHYRSIPFVVDMSHNEGLEDDEVFLNEEEEKRLRESNRKKSPRKTTPAIIPSFPFRQLSERLAGLKLAACKEEERVPEMPREHDVILKPLTSVGDDVINVKMKGGLPLPRKLTPAIRHTGVSKPLSNLSPLPRDLDESPEEDDVTFSHHIWDIRTSLAKVMGSESSNSPSAPASPRTSRERVDSYLSTASNILGKVRSAVRHPVAFTSAAIRRSIHSTKGGWMFTGPNQSTSGETKSCSENPLEGTSGLTHVVPPPSEKNGNDEECPGRSGRRDTPATVTLQGPQRLNIKQGNTLMTNTRGDVHSCVNEHLTEDQNEGESSPTNENTAMAATAEQLKQQQQQQQISHDDIAQQQRSLDNCALTTKHVDSNSINCKDTRGVRFADGGQTSEDLPSRSPVAHPKNKVLKRKNTPATLPNVDKIYAREQGSGMGSFMEEGNEEDELGEDAEDETAQATGGVM